MGRNALRFTGRWLARLAVGLVALVLCYALAGLVGSSIAVNGEWKQASEGVRIYVADNGVHTDLILPVAAADVDWRRMIRPEHLRDPRMAGHSHVSFGWGNRDFYLNTATWADVRIDRVLVALVGIGSTVVHVEYGVEPGPDPHIRAVTLTPDEYRRLAAYVQETFAGGQVVPGYGQADAFYPARGGYSALRTCNEWTGAALREAGVTMGAWTPFTFGVMRWL